MFLINIRLQLCNKAILEDGGTLASVPNQYKTQEMCNKAFDNHVHALKFVPDPYKDSRNV